MVFYESPLKLRISWYACVVLDARGAPEDKPHLQSTALLESHSH